MADDPTSDFWVARQQYVKAKRAEVRLRYALMADAEVARSVPEWRAEFDTKFRESQPEVLDIHSELRRLTARTPG